MFGSFGICFISKVPWCPCEDVQYFGRAMHLNEIMKEIILLARESSLSSARGFLPNTNMEFNK